MLYNLHSYYSMPRTCITAQPNNGYNKYHIRIIMIMSVRVVHHGVEVIYLLHTHDTEVSYQICIHK